MLPLCSYWSVVYKILSKYSSSISKSSMQLSLKIYCVCVLFYLFSNCDFIDGGDRIIQYLMYKLAKQ